MENGLRLWQISRWKMHRFFTKTIFEHGEMLIDKVSDVHHMKDVLRMSVGTKIEVSDASGKEYIAEILAITDTILLKKLEEKEVMRETPVDIHLFQGVPKGDKSEMIVQKSVELGVRTVGFVPMKRSVAKIDSKKRDKKLSRLQRIADEASKQSKRTMLPQVSILDSMQALIPLLGDMDLVLVPYEVHDATKTITNVLKECSDAKKVAIVIGPEGGFDEKEIEMLQLAGATTVSVGPRIMRTETAGITAVTCVQCYLGDF